MDIGIPYASETVTVSVPEENFMGILEPSPAESGAGKAALGMAVSEPLGSAPLSSFARKGEPVLVLVNDATRPTPTADMLSEIWETISGWDLSFLVATGTHRKPTPGECLRMFGGLWETERDRVFFHDAVDGDNLLPAGQSVKGTHVSLNRMVVEAERILVISSVEAHYFAGYTGGRKILLPGVAGRETIEENHRLAMQPEAKALSLEGNPVHEDMDSVIDLLAGKNIFALLAVTGRSQEIIGAAAGDIRQAFREAAGIVDDAVSAPFSDKADIVVAVAEPPLDRDLYQAQKSVENGVLALDYGGTLILVSPCEEGVGNDSFLKIMVEKGSPRAVLDRADADYRLGYHKAARIAAAATDFRLLAVTGLDASVVQSAFMEPYKEIQGALDAALKRCHDRGRVWLLPDAGSIVPRQIT